MLSVRCGQGRQKNAREYIPVGLRRAVPTRTYLRGVFWEATSPCHQAPKTRKHGGRTSIQFRTHRHTPKRIRIGLDNFHVDEVANHLRILRSEEHTSELQSRPHLVCRLLLEKKNNI